MGTIINNKRGIMSKYIKNYNSVKGDNLKDLDKVWKVYLIRQGDRPNSPTKIGYSSDIEGRLKSLQVSNPYKLNIQCLLPCESKEHARQLEGFLHKRYWRGHIRGEWFNLKRGKALPTLLAEFNDLSGEDKVKMYSGRRIGSGVSTSQQMKDNQNLMRENEELKLKISQLEQEMEEYLDDQFSYNQD